MKNVSLILNLHAGSLRHLRPSGNAAPFPKLRRTPSVRHPNTIRNTQHFV